MTETTQYMPKQETTAYDVSDAYPGEPHQASFFSIFKKEASKVNGMVTRILYRLLQPPLSAYEMLLFCFQFLKNMYPPPDYKINY